MVIASVIITTFNRSKILEERSLRSVLNQTFRDYEIIVVDDAGTDDTSEMIKKYPNVRYYKFSTNKGLSYARNYGISRAEGKYIVCLDDDNELAPQFLEKIMAAFYDNQVGAVGCGRIIKYKDFSDSVVPKISKFCPIDWGWLIKKEVFREIEYDEELRANEDMDFGIRFFKRFRAVVLKEPLCVAYDEFGDPKKSLSYPTSRELEGMLRFFRKNYHEYCGYPREKWHLYKLMGRKFYRGGFRLEGIKFFWKGLRAYKRFRSLLHLFFILFGWTIYDLFMTAEEKLAARLRK